MNLQPRMGLNNGFVCSTPKGVRLCLGFYYPTINGGATKIEALQPWGVWLNQYKILITFTSIKHPAINNSKR
jgi:hypothetical protein